MGIYGGDGTKRRRVLRDEEGRVRGEEQEEGTGGSDRQNVERRGGQEGVIKIEKRGKERGWRAVFWNVAEMGRRDKDFWEGLRGWEMIVLVETWVDEKGWERIRGMRPRGYMGDATGEERGEERKTKGGGMLLGIRKDLVGKECKFERGVEGMMRDRLRVGGEK